MADSTPPTGGSQAPASPPKRGRDSLVWWKYLLRTYVLLGIAALLIAGLVWEGIESGKWLWYRIGIALFMIAIAIANFVTQRRRE